VRTAFPVGFRGSETERAGPFTGRPFRYLAFSAKPHFPGFLRFETTAPEAGADGAEMPENT